MVPAARICILYILQVPDVDSTRNPSTIHHPHTYPFSWLLYIHIFVPLQSINESQSYPRSGFPSLSIISDLRNLLFHNLQGTEYPRQVELGGFKIIVIA